jgi:predicted permease
LSRRFRGAAGSPPYRRDAARPSRFGDALYRLLLYAYPRRFREVYGADMMRYLQESRAVRTSRRGPASAIDSLRFGKDLIVDLLRSVPREHLEARRARRRKRNREAGLTVAGKPSPGIPGRNPGPSSRSPGDPFMLEFLHDAAQAIRTLARRPAFALTVILTLGLGIGANTAVFSLIDGVLLAPLPYPEPDRLVQVMENNSPTNTWPMSVADLQGIERGQRTFESFAGVARTVVTVTGGETPRQVQVGYVTAQFFDVLGTPPALGRGFRVGEDVPGAEHVVVLSHAFKENWFGADADAVGETVLINAVPHTVVGVLAPGVDVLAGVAAEAWPVFQVPEPSRRGPFFITGVGRLKDGVTISDADADLARISEDLFPIWAAGFQDETAKLVALPLRDRIIGNAGNALTIAFGAVAFVLLVAVANVANLMMARATDRYREMAVRSALGAGRGRLARWLIAESLVLAAAGGALGVAIAIAGVRVFQGAGFGLPRLHEVAVNGQAIAFTALIALAGGLIFGVAPLLVGGTGQAADVLRSTSRGTSASGRAAAFRNALVAGEFALTLPLLTAAGLLVATLLQLGAVDPGIDPQGVITMSISLPAGEYADQEARQRFWTDTMAAMREIPGVVDVAAGAGLPPDAPNEYNNFDLLDKPVDPGQSQPVSPWSYVTSDYFRLLGVPVIEGRTFDDAIDNPDGARVVVVSRTWAERYFPGESAVGKQLVSGGCAQCDPTTIVGVVGDVKFRGLTGDGEAMYEASRQWWPQNMSLVIKSEAPVEATLPEIRRALRALDPDLPLDSAATMNELLHDSIAQQRHWAVLLAVFAGAALLLAAIGIFGVLSYFVRRQRLEIGVRMALGASPAAVLALVLRRGLAQAAIGIAAGVAIALLTMRWLEGMLFGVTATDPLTLSAGAALLLLAAAVACWLPGRRATHIDPVGAIGGD